MGEKGRMVRGGGVNSHIFTKKQFAQRVPIRSVPQNPFLMLEERVLSEQKVFELTRCCHVDDTTLL